MRFIVNMVRAIKDLINLILGLLYMFVCIPLLYLGLALFFVSRIGKTPITLSQAWLEIALFVQKSTKSLDSILIFILSTAAIGFFLWAISEQSFKLFDFLEFEGARMEGFIRLTFILIVSLLIPFSLCNFLMIAGSKNEGIQNVIFGITHLISILCLRGFLDGDEISYNPLPSPVIGQQIKSEEQLPNDTGLPPRPKV